MPILTKKDWEIIEKKKSGDHSDPTGRYSRSIRRKIVEVVRLSDDHGKLFKWLLKKKWPGEKFRG